MGVRASFCGFPYVEYVSDDDNKSSVSNSVSFDCTKYLCLSEYLIALHSELSRVDFDLSNYSRFLNKDLLLLKKKELNKLISDITLLIESYTGGK